MSFTRDYEMGINGESKVLPIIQNYFCKNICKSVDKFEKFDFYDEKYKYELKCRNVNYNKYPTTIVPCDKLCKNLILLFYFTDGLYFIKYGKIFNKFEKKLFARYRPDFKDLEKEYYYIPIEYLQKIPYDIL